MTTNHKFGPSSMKYRALCPGFTQDQDGDTSKADLGTLQHLAFEKNDLSILPDAATKAAVQMCLDFAKKLEVGADEVHKEVKLELLGGVSFGTADEVIIRRGERFADVLDEKYGLNLVDDPEFNWQGWCYASGVLDRWPSVDRVRVWFLMPYLDAVLSHTFHRSDFTKRINPLIRATIDRAKRFIATGDETMLNPTMEGCGICGRICGRKIGYMLSTAAKYSPLEVVEETHSSAITSGAQMVQLVDASKILRKMVDSVNEHAKRFAMEHGGITGADGELAYTLGERSGLRQLKPEKVADAVDVFIEAGLTERDLLACSDLSLTKALEIAADRAPKGKKSAVRADIESKLNAIDAITLGEPVRFLKKVKKES